MDWLLKHFLLYLGLRCNHQNVQSGQEYLFRDFPIRYRELEYVIYRFWSDRRGYAVNAIELPDDEKARDLVAIYAISDNFKSVVMKFTLTGSHLKVVFDFEAPPQNDAEFLKQVGLRM